MKILQIPKCRITTKRITWCELSWPMEVTDYREGSMRERKRVCPKSLFFF